MAGPRSSRRPVRPLAVRFPFPSGEVPMAYTLSGRLHGQLAHDFHEPLSGVLVRLYRPAEPWREADGGTAGGAATAVALKQKVALHTEEQVAVRAQRMVGEVRVDADGAYRVELGRGYEGEPLEVDLRCETVPGLRGEPRREPVQFTVATLPPEWKQGRQGLHREWDHVVAHRLWCWIRGLFDAWVICGRVESTGGGVPVPGATVRAFDADWLQDDGLGSDVTDVNGRFRIDYTSAQFRPTVFPWLNVELTEGPDVYFRVEYDGGLALNEGQADGRAAGRRDVDHCFWTVLQIGARVPTAYDNPIFTRAGNFSIQWDVDPVTGLANKSKLGVGGAGFGFFGAVRLYGFCPKKKPGTSDDMYYRFKYVHADDPATEHPVTRDLLVPWIVEDRWIPWDEDGNGSVVPTSQMMQIGGAAATSPDVPPAPAVAPGTPWGEPPVHVVVPDDDGWMKVDGRIVGSGLSGLLQLDTTALVPGGAAPGDGPGNAVSSPRNGKRLTLIFETSTDPSNPAATETQVRRAVLLVNNWEEVRLVNLQELMSGGGTPCTEIDATATVRYTVDHELIGAWDLGISTAAPGFVEPAALNAVPHLARGGNGAVPLPTAGWPACSYTLSLVSARKLTTGEWNDDANPSSVTFCIR